MDKKKGIRGEIITGLFIILFVVVSIVVSTTEYLADKESAEVETPIEQVETPPEGGP